MQLKSCQKYDLYIEEAMELSLPNCAKDAALFFNQKSKILRFITENTFFFLIFQNGPKK